MFKPVVFDVIAIAVFAVLARLAHGGVSVAAIMDTFWPFAVGVAVGAVVIAAIKLPAASLPAGIVMWLAVAATGLIIWGIRHAAVPHISFILVASIMSGILLLGWRGVARIVSSRAV